MKKIQLLSLSLLFLFFACQKNSDSPVTERGSLIGKPVSLGTYPKSLIQLAVNVAAPDYVTQVNVNYDAELHKIIYNTIDPNGNPTQASGLLVIPVNAASALPLVSYQHGTILKKSEVPSRLKGTYEVGLILATEGYVAVCPDYLGMGDGEKLHPYVHAASEATAVIDMLRAAKIVCANKGIILNDQLFLTGYSQGGHATMAALKAIEEEYSTEFNVTACASMAGPYDLSNTQMNFMLRDTAYATPGYLPYLVFAYNSVYNFYPSLDSVFIDPYNTHFKTYFNDNPSQELGAVDNLWPDPKIPSAVVNPRFIAELKGNPNFPFKKALEENDLYNWAPVTPLRLCHCDKDMHVPYQNSVVAYNYFTSHGSQDVQLINPLPGGNHSTCAVPSMIYALTWFNTFKN